MNNHLSTQIINQNMNMTFEIQFMVCNRPAQKCSGVKLVKCSFRKMSLVTEMRHCNSLYPTDRKHTERWHNITTTDRKHTER